MTESLVATISPSTDVYAECEKEIEKLRAAHAKNDVLIPEAIRLIFFRLNENPSQVRVLSLLREPGKSPSAGTVQKHINAFWETIRDRFSTPIAVPGLPDATKKAFEASVALMWKSAQEGAQRSYKELEAELAEKEQAAQNEIERVKREADLLVQATQGRVSELLVDLSHLRTELDGVMTKYIQSEADVGQLTKELDQANEKISEGLQANEKLKGSLETITASFENAKNEHASQEQLLRDEINKLHRHLSSSDDKIQNLKLAEIKLTDTVDSLRLNLSESNEKFERISQELREEGSKYIKLSQEHFKLKGLVEGLQGGKNKKRRTARVR